MRSGSNQSMNRMPASNGWIEMGRCAMPSGSGGGCGHHLCAVAFAHRQRLRSRTVTKLVDPPIGLKIEAVNLLFNIGKHILDTYDCLEE